MADHTKIEWCDATWNPIRAKHKDSGRIGQHCEKVSTGCKNCWAESNNLRGRPFNGTKLPFTIGSRSEVDVFVDQKMLELPLKWKEPRLIAVQLGSDLFGEWVPDHFISQVFATLGLATQRGRCRAHVPLILTKRAYRMRKYVEMVMTPGWAEQFFVECGYSTVAGEWIRRGVECSWLGVSVEDQQSADERIPLLLQIPAVGRFISCEPLLGPIDPGHVAWGNCQYDALTRGRKNDGARLPHLDWVIAGGESGHGARPVHPAWVRSIGAQCAMAGVPFLFKQWGEWEPIARTGFFRVGKKKAGRLLDGRTRDEFPEALKHFACAGGPHA